MTKRYLHNKKWRNKNRQTFNRGKARNYAKGATNQKNAKTVWTASENKCITDPRRPIDRKLAKKLGRTVQAIQIQRSRLRRKNS